MKQSSLSSHIFKKGKFITPINSIPLMHELSDNKSWTYGRMPEYLWIGLILHHFGRDEGFRKLNSIILELHKISPELNVLCMSRLLELEQEKQENFYDFIVNCIGKDALVPLTVVLTESKYSAFARKFCCPDYSIEDRCDTLISTMRELMDHQSHNSTDIRFVALYFHLLSGKMHLSKEEIELITKYPTITHDDELMRMARPSIRSLEMMILQFEETDVDYINYFWRCISEMTDCSLYSVNFPQENRSLGAYMENLYEIFDYLTGLYTTTSALDDKMSVLLGIATYSFKRLKEVYEHNLFNTISGRSCVRSLIENYIMMKYLVKNESSHTNIWQDYQLYGLGLYKLVLSRHRENSVVGEPHFDQKYVEALVNEFKEESFIDMDTKYFDNQNIRLKAESVDEKQLYGLYYDYDSSYEHGLWGAIRESSLLKCNNPAHKYHCVPDINDQNVLKTVLPDCVMIMNKTVSYLDELYGIPEKLLKEVTEFEIKPIDQ